MALAFLPIIRSLTSLVVVFLSGTLVVRAAPWPVHAKHTTHRTFYARSGQGVEVFHPKSSFKTFDSGANSEKEAGGLGVVASFAAAAVAVATGGPTWRLNDSSVRFVSSELGIDENNIRYQKGWSSATGKFAYLKQYIDGVPIANAVANVAYNNASQVISFGSSFINVKDATIAPATPKLSWQEVLPKIEESLGGNHTGVEPRLEYLARPDGSVALTHVIPVSNLDEGLWVEAFANADTGEVMSVVDYSAHATYTAVPIQKQNFFDGREDLVNPEDAQASPSGWVTEFDPATGLARCNNVVMFVNNTSPVNGRSTGTQIQLSLLSNSFSHAYNPDSPLDQQNIPATIDNAFYVMNTMHDFSYRYGFQEDAANFQLDNFGKGGEGSDPVQVSIRDGEDVNNAVFFTPPDTVSPIAKFFFFQRGGVVRDSAFANDIMIHEYTHGITNRMTGGGTGACLQSIEARGMGEGWGDMMAAWMAQKTGQVTEFRIGTYINPAGIRSFPYAVDETVNPLKYSDIAGLQEEHAIGEVWANMLFNVFGDLVKERGFSQNALTQPNGFEGNVVFMRIMIDGLLLQPCNPSLIQTRDAMLAADNVRYNGANQCTLWRAFARKGLGIDASPLFVDGFGVPAECT